MITSKDIQGFILKHWLKEHHCPYVCSNFSGAGYHEMDVMAATRSGLIFEFEIKMSRSDFFADFKKTAKHKAYAKDVEPGDLSFLGLNVPNRFYYAVPKGLLKVEDVPEYAGLIEFNKYGLASHPGQTFIDFTYLKKAPVLHRLKYDQKLVAKVASILSARFILGCSLMTYHNRNARESNKKLFGI